MQSGRESILLESGEALSFVISILGGLISISTHKNEVAYFLLECPESQDLLNPAHFLHRICDQMFFVSAVSQAEFEDSSFVDDLQNNIWMNFNFTALTDSCLFRYILRPESRASG